MEGPEARMPRRGLVWGMDAEAGSRGVGWGGRVSAKESAGTRRPGSRDGALPQHSAVAQRSRPEERAQPSALLRPRVLAPPSP